MTFRELREALKEADDAVLDMEVEVYSDEGYWVADLARSFSGRAFFVSKRTEDEG